MLYIKKNRNEKKLIILIYFYEFKEVINIWLLFIFVYV